MQKTEGFSKSFPEYTRILQNFSRSKIFKSNYAHNSKPSDDDATKISGPQNNINTDLLTTLVVRQSQENQHRLNKMEDVDHYALAQ